MVCEVLNYDFQEEIQHPPKNLKSINPHLKY